MVTHPPLGFFSIFREYTGLFVYESVRIHTDPVLKQLIGVFMRMYVPKVLVDH